MTKKPRKPIELPEQIDPIRRTFRTIAECLSDPGVLYPVIDHFGTDAANRNLGQTIYNIVNKCGLHDIYDDDAAVCPYCKYEYADCWEWADGEQECEECEKTFHFEASHSTTYITRPLREKEQGK